MINWRKFSKVFGGQDWITGGASFPTGGANAPPVKELKNALIISSLFVCASVFQLNNDLYYFVLLYFVLLYKC